MKHNITVLINKHADADSWHVEPIQEIVNSVFNGLIDRMRFSQFYNAFRHGRHNVRVTIANFYQSFTESVG